MKIDYILNAEEVIEIFLSKLWWCYLFFWKLDFCFLVNKNDCFSIWEENEYEIVIGKYSKWLVVLDVKEMIVIY